MQATAVVLLAAGSSRRMQGQNKLWIPLAGRPVLAHTLDAFAHSPRISTIVLVTNPATLTITQELVARDYANRVSAIVLGGDRRQDSVRQGLEALSQLAPETKTVMVHDAARPFVTESMLEAAQQAIQQGIAAVAAVPVKDTIKRVEQQLVLDTPPRESLYAVQTPQIFDFNILHQAHQHQLAQTDMTDDASLIERLGFPVRIFDGAYTNIKITTVEDMLFAEAFLARKEGVSL